MAAPGRETTACEEGEGMGNNGASFAVVVGGSSEGLIQAAQGRWRSIAMQDCGVQQAGLIKQQQRAWAPPDG
jgi:hypothetical protein